MNITMGAKIRALRKNRNLSQEVLAQQQIFHTLVPDQGKQVRKQRRIILHFQAHMNLNPVTVPVS